MRLIDATSAADYLRQTGRIGPAERVSVTELAGGVSNIVLRVDFEDAGRESFVLKQAREQLRVKEPWFCSPERIWTEVAFLRACHRLLVGCEYGRYSLGVPEVYWEDREHYVFAMEAAPRGAVTWKSRLLSGEVNPELAAAVGHLLGTLHVSSWHDAALAEEFADDKYFQDLRVDPYYRQVARVHPELTEGIDKLIRSLAANKHCLVHGDFSPKNLLVSPDRVMLIDCEVGHYGDPAFDAGFLGSHLFLKRLYHAEEPGDEEDSEESLKTFAAIFGPAKPLGLESETSYFQVMKSVLPAGGYEYLDRWVRNGAACVLARMDGKSPIDYYLSEAKRSLARKLSINHISFLVSIETMLQSLSGFSHS